MKNESSGSFGPLTYTGPKPPNVRKQLKPPAALELLGGRGTEPSAAPGQTFLGGAYAQSPTYKTFAYETEWAHTQHMPNTEIPRNYSHEAMCSQDHNADQCLEYRIQAASTDLTLASIAAALI